MTQTLVVENNVDSKKVVVVNLPCRPRPPRHQQPLRTFMTWRNYVKLVTFLQALPLGPWTGGLWFGYLTTEARLGEEASGALLQLCVGHSVLFAVTLLVLALPPENEFCLLLVWPLTNLSFIANHWAAFVRHRNTLDTLRETKDIYATVTLLTIVGVMLPAAFKALSVQAAIKSRPPTKTRPTAGSKAAEMGEVVTPLTK